VEEAEQSGIQGNVEQAQGLMRLCDQLKEERETLRKSNDNSHYNQVSMKRLSFTIMIVIITYNLCYKLTELHDFLYSSDL
jgi:hypothetical protein